MSSGKRKADDSSLSLPTDSECNGERTKRIKIDTLDAEKPVDEPEDEHLDRGSTTKKERLSPPSDQAAQPKESDSEDNEGQASASYKWRRIYNDYKSEHSQTVEEVDGMICDVPTDGASIFVMKNSLERCLLNIEAKNLEQLLKSLKKSPQYQFAECMLQKHCDESSTMLERLSKLLPLLVVSSCNVGQVNNMIATLEKQPKFVSDKELLYQVLYCMATFFFALWKTGKLPERFHYFLFYMLREIEDDEYQFIPPPKTVIEGCFLQARVVRKKMKQMEKQQMKKKHQNMERDDELTAEQSEVVNLKLESGSEKVIKVIARAGTGKTLVLEKFAKKNSEGKKILYVAFNRAVRKSMEKKLQGTGVDVQTAHSLAYGALEMEKAERKIELKEMNVLNVASYLQKRFVHSLGSLNTEDQELAKCVFRTLKAFMVSDAQTIKSSIPADIDTSKVKNVEDFMLKVESKAVDIWEEMTDLSNNKVKITHDGYFKMYQLRKPRLDKKYHCILIDEAQDMTSAQLSVLLDQHCIRILVGDPLQQVYSFRGAINALDITEQYIGNSKIVHCQLTKSFRFGPEIAHVTACLMGHMKSNQNLRLHPVVGTLDEGAIDGSREGQVTYIFRCNSTMFQKLASFVLADHPSSVKIGFVGGYSSYGFELIRDIYYLKNGAKDMIDSKSFIKRFKNFGKLYQYAIESDDVVLKGKIKICSHEPPYNIPDIIERVKERKVKKNSNPKPQYMFSTCHKAKGLEFDTVVLSDDFLRATTEVLNERNSDDDEEHLLYVAVTRAKKRLVMSPRLYRILCDAKEDLIYPDLQGLSLRVEENKTSPQCPICKKSEPIPALPFQRKQIELSTGDIVPGGVLCQDCLVKALPILQPFL